MGVKTVMLTGDNEHTARKVANDLGVDEEYSQLLPQDKVARLEELLEERRNGGTVAFVGDGINDAPVLARADVGVAMGQLGSDAAIEAADVVLMNDSLSRLTDAVRLSRKSMAEHSAFPAGKGGGAGAWCFGYCRYVACGVCRCGCGNACRA